MIFSSVATLATPSGMPMPRLTTLLGRSSSAARRAITLRSHSGMGQHAVLRHPDFAGIGRVVGSDKRLHVVRRLALPAPRRPPAHARHLDHARVQGAAFGNAFHLRNDNAPELRAAMAMASASSVRASRSMVRLPSGSAVVARMMPTRWERPCRTGIPCRHRVPSAAPGLRWCGVDLAAAPARVHKGVQAHMGQRAGLARGDVTKQWAITPCGRL
jgi:hypothetical protein